MAFRISSLKVERTHSKTQRSHLTALSSRQSGRDIQLLPTHFYPYISSRYNSYFFSTPYLHLLENNEEASGTGKLNV
jgi:hypothetical protein